MPEIYISNSSETAVLAKRLAKDLESRGFQTFQPSRDIKEGAEFPLVAQRVADSDAFIVLIGSNQKRSTAQEREWFAVLNEASDLKKKKKLIPLIVGDGELPNFLKNWEALRLREPVESNRWDKLVDTISTALQSLEEPKFKPLPKADLEQRRKRLDSIAETAAHLKSLGF